MLDTTLVDIPFSPSMLLPVRLSPVIVCDGGYQAACEFGYFECLFVSRTCSTWEELRAEIVEDVLIAHDRENTPLSHCAGVVLGYLSAFAVVDRVLALRGVELLETLINSYGVRSFMLDGTC